MMGRRTLEAGRMKEPIEAREVESEFVAWIDLVMGFSI